MPDGLNTYKSTLTGPELDAALRNIGLVEQNIAAAAASAEAAANSAEDAKIAAQEALGFRTFFSAITPDANGSLDTSCPMTTPTAQASWTIESKGDRIQSVQVNGPASDGQSGGLSLKKMVVSSKTSYSYNVVNDCSIAYIQNTGIATPDDQSKNVIFASQYFKPVALVDRYKDLSVPAVYTSVGNIYLRLPSGTSNFEKQDWNDLLNSLGLKLWFPVTEESQATGLYIPIQAQGHEYRCQCLPLTEALVSGDNVQSAAPSGCDKVFTFDGSSDELWYYDSNLKRYLISLGSDILSSDSNVNLNPSFTNRFKKAVSGGTATGKNVYAITNGTLYVRTDGSETLESFKEGLSISNLVLWCTSNQYAQRNDIPVSIETHTSGNIYAHPAVDLVAVPYTDADSGHPAGTYDVSSQDGTTVSVSLKPMQDGGNAAMIAGHTWEDIQKLISDAVTAAVQMAKA